MTSEEVQHRFAHAGNEAAVIACVLRDASNYFQVESKLTDNDFLTPHHRALWRIIKTLTRQDVVTLDAATILAQSEVLKLSDMIGGYDYINALFEKSVDPHNIDFYIDRLTDASTKFQVMEAIKDIEEVTDKNRVFTGDNLNADTIVEFAQDKFLQIAVSGQRGEDASDLAEGLDELLDEIASSPDGARGFPTSFPILDEAINGLETGTLTVLGARPKTGKSALLLNWAIHMAYQCKKPVLYLDTEMSTREQQFRALSILSGVPEREIKNGTYLQNPENGGLIRKAIEIMNSGLILHKYYPDFTPEGVCAQMRKYHHQGRADTLFFDYIKLAGSDLQQISSVKEHQALGYLCVALKNLAGELDIPVITAAQIGRGGANKGHATSADFADTDRILRYANTLLALSAKTQEDFKKAEEEYGRENTLKMGTHRLQILDTRGGGTNFEGIDLYFRKEILTMREAMVQRDSFLTHQEVDNEY